AGRGNRSYERHSSETPQPPEWRALGSVPEPALAAVTGRLRPGTTQARRTLRSSQSRSAPGPGHPTPPATAEWSRPEWAWEPRSPGQPALEAPQHGLPDPGNRRQTKIRETAKDPQARKT